MSGHHSSTILSCDIGGTNASLALLHYDGIEFRKTEDLRLSSQQATSISEILAKGLKKFKGRPDYCCISGAGPIKDGICYVSNLPWDIDRRLLEKEFDIPVKIINDFSAIAFSLPLLGEEQMVSLTPHQLPETNQHTYVVVGAGTGLGVGAITRTAQHGFLPIASEGGHGDISPSLPVERELCSYWQDRLDSALDAEFFVSGPGIERIFRFWLVSKRFADDRVANHILAKKEAQRPALITSLSKQEPDCKNIVAAFLHLYGKAAANACLYFSATPALFIAGGIITKIADILQNTPDFLQGFYSLRHKKMKEYLQSIPISLITDYSVSLLGAAHAIVLDRKFQERKR